MSSILDYNGQLHLDDKSLIYLSNELATDFCYDSFWSNCYNNLINWRMYSH